MTHYFDTEEQRCGDKALEDGDYLQALECYKKVFNRLAAWAELPSSKPDTEYNDKKAYILCDMVITRCWYMSSCMDDNGLSHDVSIQWNTIRQLLKRVHSIIASISSYPDRQTTTEKINYMYAAIAQTCEYISDTIMDEDVCNPDQNKLLIIDQIKNSRLWLGKAINYKFKSGKPIDSEMHLVYLNLFQREYELATAIERKYKILIIFTSYIEANANNLLKLDLGWMDKLDVMKYQLFVAIEHKTQDARIIAEQCQQLINAHLSEVNEIENDQTLIKDVSKLIKKARSMDDESASCSPNKRTKLVDASEEKLFINVTFDHTGLINHSMFVPVQTNEEMSMETFCRVMKACGETENIEFQINILKLIGYFFHHRSCFKRAELVAKEMFKIASQLENSQTSGKDVENQTEDYKTVFVKAIEHCIDEMDGLVAGSRDVKMSSILPALLTFIAKNGVKYSLPQDVTNNMKNQYHAGLADPIGFLLASDSLESRP